MNSNIIQEKKAKILRIKKLVKAQERIIRKAEKTISNFYAEIGKEIEEIENLEEQDNDTVFIIQQIENGGIIKEQTNDN